MLLEVWKDFDYKITGVSDYVEYEVNVYTPDDGAYDENIYKGRAKAKPNTKEVTIRLSDFAKDVVNSKADDRFLDGVNRFCMLDNYCMGVGVVHNNKETIYNFINNYDYNESNKIPYIISNPITEYTDRGYNIISIFNESNRLAEFGVEWAKNSFNYEIYPYQAFLFQLKNMAVGNYKIVDETNKTLYEFTVKHSCSRYKIHYINAMGGYDTMVLEAPRDLRTDNFSFDNYETNFNNQNIQQRGVNRYKVDITPKWELHTGWLNDEQSKKMYNVFSSTMIWLEDTEEDKIYPVHITNNSLDYKTFTNNGKKLISYTINLESSNKITKH